MWPRILWACFCALPSLGAKGWAAWWLGARLVMGRCHEGCPCGATTGEPLGSEQPRGVGNACSQKDALWGNGAEIPFPGAELSPARRSSTFTAPLWASPAWSCFTVRLSTGLSATQRGAEPIVHPRKVPRDIVAHPSCSQGHLGLVPSGATCVSPGAARQDGMCCPKWHLHQI